MADLFEAIMIITFGVSWPINIVKLWRARTTKGVSILFYCLIFLGYIFGIVSKVIKLVGDGVDTPLYVWFFYILNSVMVFVGIIVWFINRRIEIKESHNV